jgi:hypothetical protein
MQRLAWLALVTLALAGCGDDDTAAPDAGGDSPDAAAGPDGGVGVDQGYRTDLTGSVRLIESGGDGFGGWISAWFWDAPAAPVERLVERVGDCALYDHPLSTECEVPCTGFCDGTECQPWPDRMSAGTIELTGLLTDFTLVPTDYGYSIDPYPEGGDYFASDAAIVASAAGDDVEAFTMVSRGVAPLIAPAAMQIDLHSGQAFELTWTPDSDGARIQLALRIGWHGAPYRQMLLCETEDDGSLTIPVALIDRLPDFGGPDLFQHPSEMTRFRRVVIETSTGPIELLVGSGLPAFFTVNYPER